MAMTAQTRDVLAHRVMSGTLIVTLLVLAANHLPAVGAWVLLVLVCSLGLLEFYRMLNLPGIPVYRYLGVFCGAAMVTATFFVRVLGVAPAMASDIEHQVLAAVLLRQFPARDNPKPLGTIACTLLGIAYIPYLFNYFTRLAFAWDNTPYDMQVGATGRNLIFYLVLVVKSTDVGAYFTGRALGRHKLCPRLSPRKTWEGLAGGVGCALVASLLFVRWHGGLLGQVRLSTLDAVCLGVLLSLAGVLGDMFESLLKRASGAKDSGTIVPGMGGVLDVLDSLLFAAPVLYFYARWLG
jgi:phosphatidate cytidylyltransferase